MISTKRVLAVLMLIGMSPIALGAPITITAYDVYEVPLPGFGGWFHRYAGDTSNATLRPIPNGQGDLVDVQFVNETGGSGELNNGVIENTVGSTYLFRLADASGTVPTSIVLHLDGYYYIDSISLFGGPLNNGVPGRIDGVTVDINGTSEFFATTDFGPVGISLPVNDLATLSDSNLSGLLTNTIILSGWSVIAGPNMSIAEIQVDGVATIPEPSTWALLGAGLIGLGFVKSRASHASRKQSNQRIRVAVLALVGSVFACFCIPATAVPLLYGIDGGGQVTVIDVQSQSVQADFASLGLNGGASLTFGPDGLLYGVDSAGNLRGIDVDSQSVVKLFSTGGMSDGAPIAFGPDGLLYGIDGGGNVRALDTAAETFVNVFPSINLPGDAGLAFGADGLLYAIDAAGRVTAIDVVSESIVDAFMSLGLPSGAAVTFGPDGLLYGVDLASNIRVIDVVTQSVLNVFFSGGYVGGADLAFADDGLLYGVDGGGNIRAIDVTSESIVHLFPSIRFFDGSGLAFQPPIAVPEPSTLGLLGAGLLGLFMRRKRITAVGEQE